MQEVKFNYQNIQIKVAEDTFEVINKNLFTNTKDYDCMVTLTLRANSGRNLCRNRCGTACKQNIIHYQSFISDALVREYLERQRTNGE